MWVTVGIGESTKIILYHYHATRRGEVAVKALDGYTGYLQTDGYSGYNEVGSVAGIHHVSDFVHIRRKFEQADQVAKGNGEAQRALGYIRELYRIEEELRETELPPDRFVSERKRLATGHLDSMYEWMLETLPAIPPRTMLGQAFSYAMSQWEKAVRYLEHPLMTPDTSKVENSIRPFVVGRKNWLFSATPRGAHASGTLYSLIETAKANGLEPYRYLCYLFRKLPQADTKNKIRSLLPYLLKPDDLIDTG